MNSKQHLSSEQTEIMYCTQCGKLRQPDDRFCGYCGHPFTAEAGQHECENAPRREQYEKTMKCPRCGSASLSDGQKAEEKKGSRAGKAVVGAAKFIVKAVLFGPIGGVLERQNGSKKAIVTCKECGYQFKK